MSRPLRRNPILSLQYIAEHKRRIERIDEAVATIQPLADEIQLDWLSTHPDSCRVAHVNLDAKSYAKHITAARDAFVALVDFLIAARTLAGYDRDNERQSLQRERELRKKEVAVHILGMSEAAAQAYILEKVTDGTITSRQATNIFDEFRGLPIQPGYGRRPGPAQSNPTWHKRRSALPSALKLERQERRKRRREALLADPVAYAEYRARKNKNDMKRRGLEADVEQLKAQALERLKEGPVRKAAKKPKGPTPYQMELAARAKLVAKKRAKEARNSPA